jgi:hypothetical protein
MIDNVSLYFSTMKSISNVISFIFRLCSQLKGVSMTHSIFQKFVKEFCINLEKRMKNSHSLIWKSLLLNPNTYKLIFSCIQTNWISKVDMNFYVLEIQDILNLFIISKSVIINDLIGNIDAIIGCNNDFNLEKKTDSNEFFRF